MAAHVPIESFQKRIFLRFFQQRFPNQMSRDAPSQARFSSAYGTFDYDIAAIFQLHVLRSFDLLFFA
jgi:hypothetical protein